MPFFVVGTLLDANALVTFTTVVLLFSFAHQPLTFPLVYGDRSQFAAHRILYLVAPPVMVALVYSAGQVSLALLAVVATTWNAIHTLRQRYGIVRLYGRKVGQRTGEFEQQILFSAYLGVIAFAAWQGTVSDRLGALPIGRVNRQIVSTIDDLRLLALVVASGSLIVFVRAVFRWWQLEQARPVNASKHHYLVAAAALCVAIAFDPVAGLLAFAGAHAAEYFVTVGQNVEGRFASAPGALRTTVTGPLGPWGSVAVFTVGVLMVVALARPYLGTDLYAALYLGLGGLHFLYDGFIWRSRAA